MVVRASAGSRCPTPVRTRGPTSRESSVLHPGRVEVDDAPLPAERASRPGPVTDAEDERPSAATTHGGVTG